MREKNQYSRMQKTFYEKSAKHMAKGDHKEHNNNPDYYSILLENIDQSWNDKLALDFGCGTGRNIENLFKLANWKRVDGCDISKENLKYAKENLEKNKVDTSKIKLYENNGVDLKPINDNVYDFIMSTIVFQHICVYNIRFSLFQDIYRVLKPNGLFSFQMGFGEAKKARDYYDNYIEANATNGLCDVQIVDEKDLIDDLTKIGFKNINFVIRDSFSDANHPQWIYIKATK